MPEEQTSSGEQAQENPRTQRTGRRRLPGWMTLSKKIDPTTPPIVSNSEVYALLEYAASHGISKVRVKRLSKAIHDPHPDPSEIAFLYTDLVSVTKPVSGRTLIDSNQWVKRLRWLSLVTSLFFLLAVGNYVADNWLADIVEPEEGPTRWGVNLLDVKTYVWDYLTPLCWGALGSCVFLLKAVQDAAKARVYEHHWMEGWGTRVLIGGILAAVFLIIFDPSNFLTDSLRPAGIAFLIGLGVKPVYGALERTIEILSDKLDLKSIRREPADKGGDGV